MSNLLTYRGYAAAVEFDSDDMLLVGHVAGINDVIGFHASTAEELVAAFHDAVDDYLEACVQVGKKPEKEFSGNVQFRLTPALHYRVARAAELAGKSINQWGEALFEKATTSV